MKEKNKIQKGFIQIPLSIIVLVSVIGTGISYGAFEYHKTSKVLEEAGHLTKEEKYNEAIERLDFAKNDRFVAYIGIGITEEKINEKIDQNKILSEDKSKYNQGLNEFNKENWQEGIELFSEIPDGSFYYQSAKTKIEETKRIMVEEELAEEKVARKEAEQKAEEETIKRANEEIARRAAEKKAKEEEETRKEAEQKAKQEEIARKAKEKELSEKKAEERRMSADNDGDGLTYRRELELGTSDWNTDSDGDGIPDNLDTHPAGGGRNIPQTFAWSYSGYNWTWTESIHEDWYDYYKAKPRSSPESIEYITSDDPFIKKISKRISEGIKGDIGEVWLAISFVQNLPYVDDAFTGYDEYPKYPIETFFEKNGDCEDTSYLAASIVDAMGFGSVLILLPGHMAVGIYMNCDTPGTYYEFDGRCYYYVETTSKDWAGGKIPDRYRNTRATLIKIPSGKTTDAYPKYIKPCHTSSYYSGYYYDGSNYYSDSQCNNLVYCLSVPDEELYYNYRTESFYWDSGCNQIVVKGCAKATSYPGYFTNGIDYYSDSRCSQKAKICRSSSVYSDRYWDGVYNYWDSSCTQKVVSWCSKSIYHPGYFFNSLDYEYYYDYQCIQKADL